MLLLQLRPWQPMDRAAIKYHLVCLLRTTAVIIARNSERKLIPISPAIGRRNKLFRLRIILQG